LQLFPNGLADRRLFARLPAPALVVEAVAEDVDVDHDFVGDRGAPELVARDVEVLAVDGHAAGGADPDVAPRFVRTARRRPLHRNRDRLRLPLDREIAVHEPAILSLRLDARRLEA